jgi:hypothetical protein
MQLGNQSWVPAGVCFAMYSVNRSQFGTEVIVLAILIRNEEEWVIGINGKERSCVLNFTACAMRSDFARFTASDLYAQHQSRSDCGD